MANHIVYLDLSIVMEEMDGTPAESAEVLLSLDVLGKVIEVLKQEGYESQFQFDNVWAEESPTR